MKVKGIMALIVSIAMIMGVMPLNMCGISFKAFKAEAVETDAFNVTGNSSGYSYVVGLLTISSGGEYTISMAEGRSATSNRISVTATDNDVIIILDNVNISTASGSPLEIATTSQDVTVKLRGSNYLKTTERNFAGLQKGDGNNKLIITNADADKEGSLEATGGRNGAGIGGGGDGSTSNITITGGNVTATGGTTGAGIGGGNGGSGSSITISSGEVNAAGGTNGAGIGGGNYGSGSSITISGGTVTATGSANAAGIGGGNGGSGSYIEISGGEVNATGGGAGIGGGDSGSGSNIEISGGTVTATGDVYAAGIGGGWGESGSNITISGGTVTATGGTNGAGIGGGTYYGNGSNITISGGTVTATGGYNGAGIGGGWSGSGSNITISGGTVTATGGTNGAGIGGGYRGEGIDIKISPEEGSFLFARYAVNDPFDAYVSETDITNTVKETTYFYSTDAPYFEEAGTETEPYLISDLTDLMIFSAYVKNTGNGALNKYFKVTDDIDMTSVYNGDTSWEGVGTSASRAQNFRGIFDGDGHNINVYVNDTSNTRQGLFGVIGAEGIVRNLSVSGSVTCMQYAGGIAGINYGTIENCKSSVNVTSSSYAVGGIVGSIGTRDGSNSGTVINCYSTGNVTGTSRVGGVVGRVSEEECIIKNCYSTGTVTGTSEVGGVVGGFANLELKCTIENCYYLEGSAVGGIGGADTTGSAEAKTADEFASGEVTYLLNGSLNSDDSVWKQTLGSDDYPGFDGLNVVGFTKNSDGDMFYANKVEDDSVSITTPENGTFKVTVDTSKFGGEGAKYLEAVNVIAGDEAAKQITNYEYSDEEQQYIQFDVSYTGAQDYEIRAEIEAKENGTADKIMYYVTGIVTAPAYAGDETEATSLDLNAE